MNNKYDTIIIGSGLSGLLCGAYLSKNGQKVCILEKHNQIGGAIQTFKRKQITFDTGMHFFGAVRKGQIQYELFKLFGITDKLEIEEIENFKSIIEDKEYILPTGFKNYSNKLKSYFPKEEKAINIYISKLNKIIENITIKNIKKGFDLNEDHTNGIYHFVKSITKNKDLQDVLLFNNMLYSTKADKASVYIHSVINASFIQSTGMFKNGTTNFLNILRNNIENNGGKIITSEEVKKIIIDGAEIQSCLGTSGQEYKANNYISTIHPKLSLELSDTNLIKKFYRKRISNLENTESTFLLFIEMKKETFLFQNPIFICENKTKNEFNTSYMLYTPPSGKNGKYANIIKVMIPMNFKEVEKWKDSKLHKRPNEYKLFKQNKTEELLNLIEKRYPNFQNNIKNIYSSTPLTYRDYTGIINGSAYGIINDYNNAIKSMISVRTKIKNLYYSGQNINFHGMLGVSITSLITSETIINNEKINKKNT